MNEPPHATTATPTTRAPATSAPSDTGRGLDGLITSLELAAERVPDFYHRVFERYFELCPDSQELMSHTDAHIRGRMMEQVVSLLMDDDIESLDTYFAFEAANHFSYGAQPHMYENLFDACKQVVTNANAKDWNNEAARAWQSQTARLLRAMHKHLPLATE